MDARKDRIRIFSFVASAMVAIVFSAPALAESSGRTVEREPVEEVVVTGHRPNTIHKIDMHDFTLGEQLKSVLEETIHSITHHAERDVVAAPEQQKVAVGHDPEEDSDLFIDTQRQQMMFHLVRPANVLRVKF